MAEDMRLFVDNLTNVDFSYLDGQRGLVGETWLANIELTGELDDQGMVCDFGIVKKTVRHWLDTMVDHCLVVPSKAPELTLNEPPEYIELSWQYSNDEAKHEIKCRAPNQAITLINAATVTPETVAQWCIERLIKELPASITHLSLSFIPEAINGAAYHYSHGLKKHDGNCQRIAHGHRSSIEIYCNDRRDDALEAQWAKKWQDIYIGTREDLVGHLDHTKSSGDATHEFNYDFNYTSEQGEFHLSLPAKQCYLIDADTTVENIARHIASELKQAQPSRQFRVKAFEGIGKGAICDS